MTERKIFDLVDSPFGPFNLVNETFERTGNFKSGSLSAIQLFDSNTVNFNYEHFQKYSLTHIESLADQIVDFDPTQLEQKRALPKLDFLEFSGLNQAKWMSPVLNSLRLEVNEFAQKLNRQLTQSRLRRELKMDEDPWDNYLAFDAKHFLPILNHTTGRPIVEQILLFKFVQHAVRNETISQYNVKDLGTEFLDFAREY